ncbi:MAG: helix-turn-helix domain-containing protein [Pseudomonadota bacterium]
MTRRKLSRLIKSHHVYTPTEAAIALGRTPRTVRNWVRGHDLPAATDQRPWLIDGRDLKRFLDARDADRSVSLADDEMFCLPCRAARRSAFGLVQYVPAGPSNGRLSGFCPVCETEMHRAINQADTARFQVIYGVPLTMAAE